MCIAKCLNAEAVLGFSTNIITFIVPRCALKGIWVLSMAPITLGNPMKGVGCIKATTTYVMGSTSCIDHVVTWVNV